LPRDGADLLDDSLADLPPSGRASESASISRFDLSPRESCKGRYVDHVDDRAARCVE
jgi:hypothetical protein